MTHYLSHHHHSIPMQNQHQLTIIYNKFCPFAQRALLTAIEKDLPATFTKVSLSGQDQVLNSTYKKALGKDPKYNGKVPVLIHGDRVLAESEPVCWYLAETFPSSGSSLIPADTFQTARMRLLIAQQSAAVMGLFDKVKYKQVTSTEDFQKEVRGVLGEFETAIRGDFMLGKDVSLADLLIYPWFERWIIMQRVTGVSLNDFGGIAKWLAKLGERRSVIETKKLTTEEYYLKRSEKMYAAKL